MNIPKVTISDLWQAFVEPLPEVHRAGIKYDRLRSCTGKLAQTEEVAKKAAIAQTRNRGQEYVAYQCRWCKWYHVGRKFGWKKGS